MLMNLSAPVTSASSLSKNRPALLTNEAAIDENDSAMLQNASAIGDSLAYTGDNSDGRKGEWISSIQFLQ